MQIFKLLIEHGAEVNMADASGSTPLRKAASVNKDQSHSNMIKMLEKGADVNTPNGLGRMPIYNLVQDGNVKLVKLFLDSGAEVNAKSFQGRTPMYNAIWYGSFKVVELLFKNGLDVNSPDKYELILLHQAA